MTLSEIFEYMLAGVPDDYDISAGSFFYDLLYPVAEQIYFLQQKIQDLTSNGRRKSAASVMCELYHSGTEMVRSKSLSLIPIISPPVRI